MKLWVPGAKLVVGFRDGGSMVGGPKKALWHSTESDPRYTSPTAIANYLNKVAAQVHLIWNPVTGDMVCMLPANRGGRGLVNQGGGVETNRGGDVVYQIEVIGFAKDPFTNGPCKNLNVILDFLAQLGVDGGWPAGNPQPYPQSYGGYRSSSDWNHTGHFTHSQAPENLHGDPGSINVSMINTTGSGGSVPSGKKPSSIVKRGMAGPAVARVQKLVGATADGVFGPNTEKKVKRYQKKIGVAADGVWGPSTEKASREYRARHNKKGSRDSTRGLRFPLGGGHYYGVDDGTLQSHSGIRGGADKRNIKKIQRKVGCTADGIFGSITRAKVKRFQRNHNLNADGLVGSNTWAKMF